MKIKTEAKALVEKEWSCKECDAEGTEYALITSVDKAVEHEKEFHGQKLTQNGLEGNYVEIQV